MKNYYNILDLDRDLSTKILKNKSFELGKKYHPKKVKSGLSSTTKFIEIIEAYSVLQDINTREVYNWILDHNSGKNILREPAIESHRKTIEMESSRGCSIGKEYTTQPFWIFRDDMKSSFWWNLISIFPF